MLFPVTDMSEIGRAWPWSWLRKREHRAWTLPLSPEVGTVEDMFSIASSVFRGWHSRRINKPGGFVRVVTACTSAYGHGRKSRKLLIAISNYCILSSAQLS